MEKQATSGVNWRYIEFGLICVSDVALVVGALRLGVPGTRPLYRIFFYNSTSL